MATGGFEDLHVYRLSEQLADMAWQFVSEWDFLAKDTVGRQLIRAADGVGPTSRRDTDEGVPG